MRFNHLLVGPVAHLPWRLQSKLLVSFLAIVALLIALGAVGLYTLSGVNQRTEELIRSERKIAAYRQVQHDTTSQLYSITSALLVSDERTLDSALRQLNQFGYDLERLQFVAKDEIKLLGKVREEYDRFIAVVTRVVELIRGGHVEEAREAQLKEARPLANRLERLTNELVNKAEADVVAGIEASGEAYRTSQTFVVAFAIGAIVFALILGRTISLSFDRADPRDRTHGSMRLPPAISRNGSRSAIAMSWARWRPTSTGPPSSSVICTISSKWRASTNRLFSPA